MSETELDDERGESYLEIQMDRSTIVLAVLGLVALLAAAFLIGSWFGSRSREEVRSEASAASAEDDAPADHDGEDVVAEEGFGGKAVSAQGAPPIGAVPPPSAPRAASAPASGGAPVVEEPVGAAVPPRASGPARVPAGKATSPKATAAKATAAKATAAKATSPKATAAKATAAKATAAPAPAGPTSAWVVQLAAVKDRAEAEQFAGRVRARGYEVRIVEEGGFVKVQAGPFDTKAQAQAAEQRLKRDGFSSTWLKRG